MRSDCVLDLERRNVLAASDDHVFESIHHLEETVGPPPPTISRPKPSVDDGVFGRHVIIEVAMHDLVPSHRDLARLADPERHAGRIADLNLDSVAWSSRGQENSRVTVEAAPVLSGIQEDRIAGELRHSIALREGDTKGAVCPAEELWRHGRGAVGERRQRGESRGLLGVQIQMVPKRSQHRGRHGGGRHV